MAVEKSVSISSVPAETVISADTKFKGSVCTDKPIVIDGFFEGEIKSTSTVVVSESGVVNASIECANMKLLGKGEGTIACQELFQFGENGEYVGDISTTYIEMGRGAKLDGKVKIG